MTKRRQHSSLGDMVSTAAFLGMSLYLLLAGFELQTAASAEGLETEFPGKRKPEKKMKRERSFASSDRIVTSQTAASPSGHQVDDCKPFFKVVQDDRQVEVRLWVVVLGVQGGSELELRGRGYASNLRPGVS